MFDVLIPWIWALVWAGLGGVGYILFLNRYLIHMPDHPLKKWAFLYGVFLFILLSACIGHLLAGTIFVWLACLILIMPGLGTFWNWRIRQRYYCTDNQTPPQAILTPPHGPFTTRHLVLRKFSIHLPKWRGPRIRVAHISDLHVGKHSPMNFYQAVHQAIINEKPDIVVMTGDFVDRLSGLPQLEKVLALFSGLPVYAVFGNHDFWAGPEKIVHTLVKSGLKLLNNTGQVIDGSPSIFISGTTAPWRGTTEIQPMPPDTLHLVLSHTPDNIYELEKQDASIVFSGHTHAGQGRLPGWGSIIVPSKYGRRFDRGHFLVGQTHLFVCSGLGAVNPPFRLFCKPDILLIDIHGAEKV